MLSCAKCGDYPQTFRNKMLKARLLFSQLSRQSQARYLSYFRGGNLENVNQDIDKIAEGRFEMRDY